MLFLDTIDCTASSDGVLFAQVLQTFPQLIIVWSTTCCRRFVHIHKVPGILLVWHRLRDSFCYWSHPSVVGTPGTECGACIALLIAGIPTKLKKALSESSRSLSHSLSQQPYIHYNTFNVTGHLTENNYRSQVTWIEYDPSQNSDLKILLLVLSFTAIAVSGLILRWKAKELCSDPELEKAPCHELSN